MNDLNIEAFVKALTYEQAEEVIKTISKYFNIQDSFTYKLPKQDITSNAQLSTHLTEDELDNQITQDDSWSKNIPDKVNEILDYIDFDEVKQVDRILKDTAYGISSFDFLFYKKIGPYAIARKILTDNYSNYDYNNFFLYRYRDKFEVVLKVSPKDCFYKVGKGDKQQAIKTAVKYFLPVFNQMGWEWQDETVTEESMTSHLERLTNDCEKRRDIVSAGRLRTTYHEEKSAVSISLEIEHYSDW